MSDSNTRKPTKEEIKEYLIAISKDITEINKVLREDIEDNESDVYIEHCIFHLIKLGFTLDKLTSRKYTDIYKQFLNNALIVS